MSLLVRRSSHVAHGVAAAWRGDTPALRIAFVGDSITVQKQGLRAELLRQARSRTGVGSERAHRTVSEHIAALAGVSSRELACAIRHLLPAEATTSAAAAAAADEPHVAPSPPLLVLCSINIGDVIKCVRFGEPLDDTLSHAFEGLVQQLLTCAAGCTVADCHVVVFFLGRRADTAVVAHVVGVQQRILDHHAVDSVDLRSVCDAAHHHFVDDDGHLGLAGARVVGSALATALDELFASSHAAPAAAARASPPSPRCWSAMPRFLAPTWRPASAASLVAGALLVTDEDCAPGLQCMRCSPQTAAPTFLLDAAFAVVTPAHRVELTLPVRSLAAVTACIVVGPFVTAWDVHAHFSLPSLPRDAPVALPAPVQRQFVLRDRWAFYQRIVLRTIFIVSAEHQRAAAACGALGCDLLVTLSLRTLPSLPVAAASDTAEFERAVNPRDRLCGVDVAVPLAGVFCIGPHQAE